LSSLPLREGLLTSQESHGPRGKHMLQKSLRQAEERALSFGVNLPRASQLRPAPDFTLRAQNAAHSSPGPDRCRYVWYAVTPVLQSSPGEAASHGQGKRFPEPLQVIAATTASILKSRKKPRRSPLPQLQRV